MNCPRCNGGCILRTRDHDELIHFREPYACASCGLAFDGNAKRKPAQASLFPTLPVTVPQARAAMPSWV